MVSTADSERARLEFRNNAGTLRDCIVKHSKIDDDLNLESSKLEVSFQFGKEAFFLPLMSNQEAAILVKYLASTFRACVITSYLTTFLWLRFLGKNGRNWDHE